MVIPVADIWFRKLGFSRNPFSIKPAAFSYELYGLGIDGVLSGIDEGKALFVEAPLGYGKTTLLKSIINRYGGKKKVIYAHALPLEKLDVKGLLKRSSIANYLTGSIPAGVILVVDEAQNIQADSSAEIEEFYKSGNIRAVVFFGTKYPGSAVASGFGKVLNGNVIRLSRPTPEQAISIVRERVGSLPLISNEDILSAYRRAQGSPRRLLQICEDFCRGVVEGRKPVSVEPAARPVKAVRKPKARSKKAVRVPAMANISKTESVPVRKPELVAPVGDVSSTLDSSSSIEISPPAAGIRKAVKPKAKSAPGKKKKPGRKKAPKAGVKYAVTVAPGAPRKTKPLPDKSDESSKEGVYWGEFMGMQK